MRERGGSKGRDASIGPEEKHARDQLYGLLRTDSGVGVSCIDITKLTKRVWPHLKRIAAGSTESVPEDLCATARDFSVRQPRALLRTFSRESAYLARIRAMSGVTRTFDRNS